MSRKNLGHIADTALNANSNYPVQNKVIKQALDTKANTSDLATVATSGSYNDLSNKPTIPDMSTKMDKDNPTGTGSFSLNRKANTTVGDYSFAEGYSTTASGNRSHAEGEHTTASGIYSHAEGYSATASGDCTHAEGYSTTASGGRSHAEGHSTTASGDCQHVQGKYNVEDTNNQYADIIGNGNSRQGKNIEATDWNGNKHLKGDLYTGCNDDSTGGTSLTDRLAEKADIDDIQAIEEKIPAQASSSNQLADKNFVNSSIGTNTANYISNQGEPFTSLAQLQAYTGTVTNNDYAFVTGTDESGNTYFDRYKATVSGTTVSWAKEYRLNNSSFTAVQWAAISSGITASKVAEIAQKANTSDLAEVATSGDYDDLSNKPTIPTKTSDLTNDSNFVSDANYVHTDNNFTDEKLKMLEAELPTDAILHYSFDEVPDLPDGTAVWRKNKDFTSSDYFSTDTASAITNEIVNGNLKITLTSLGYCYKVKTAVNPIITVKFKCSTTRPIIFAGRLQGQSLDTQFKTVNVIANEWVETSFAVTGTLISFVLQMGNVTLEIEKLYIGDGSYNTPVIDNANGQYHGTNNGGLAVQGMSGKGIRFVDGKITGTIPELTTFSVNVWVKHIALQHNYPYIVSFGDDFRLYFDNGISSLVAYFLASTNNIRKTLSNPTEWNCITYTVDTGTVKLYVNGELVGSHDYTPRTFSRSLCIGNAISISRGINGELDDFQIFNRALTEKEVLGLYLAKGNTPKYYSRADWWIDNQNTPALTMMTPPQTEEITNNPVEEN